MKKALDLASSKICIGVIDCDADLINYRGGLLFLEGSIKRYSLLMYSSIWMHIDYKASDIVFLRAMKVVPSS